MPEDGSVFSLFTRSGRFCGFRPFPTTRSTGIAEFLEKKMKLVEKDLTTRLPERPRWRKR